MSNSNFDNAMFTTTFNFSDTVLTTNDTQMATCGSFEQSHHTEYIFATTLPYRSLKE